MDDKLDIEAFWNNLVSNGELIVSRSDGYELIYPKKSSPKTKTLGGKWSRIIAISRHKTPKHLLKIYAKAELKNNNYKSTAHVRLDYYPSIIFNKSVIVTTDHVCMIYNKDHFFENTNAKNLKVGDYVSIYIDKFLYKNVDKELIGTITKIEDFGTIDEWVYDLEVEDQSHSFYANDILVHNSQFVNISCIVQSLLKQNIGNGKDISKWNDEDKLKLWKFVDNFVEKEVNPYVQDLIKNYCYTEHPEVLRYSLEYVSACGIYEAKKHYATRKVISEGPELVDKIKFSGIELKKASVPQKVKDVLKDIYEGILLHNWTELNFMEYIYNIWDDFKKLTIDEISFWKGYSSAREASGFLQMQKGSTAVASASTYYNQIIKKLGLGKKYDQILLGQKVRFCYVKPTNEYRIEYIAFPDGQWPEEFNKIFEIDYEVMFDKLVTSSLKGFMTATKFSKVDPTKQIEYDVLSL